MPFGQAKATQSTNISVISLHLKILTDVTRQGKDLNTQNKERSVSLFAGTWEAVAVNGLTDRTCISIPYFSSPQLPLVHEHVDA